MKKYFIIIVLFFFQHLYSEDKSEILFAMDKYNEAFILADYDQIIESFIFPVSESSNLLINLFKSLKGDGTTPLALPE